MSWFSHACEQVNKQDRREPVLELCRNWEKKKISKISHARTEISGCACVPFHFVPIMVSKYTHTMADAHIVE